MERYFDRNGKPITLEEMARFDLDYRRVLFDKIDGIEVSTVWLGLNHNYGDGPPLIFETMIFGGDNNEWCRRYATIAQAIAGHKAVLEALKAGAELPE